MKRIAIIGGGISGLAALHYLIQRFGDSVEINLYERQSNVGGNIQSLHEEGFCCELGPNGFLSNQPNTLEFIEQLDCGGLLITANLRAKRRFIQYQGQLIQFPTDPVSFAKFKPLNIFDAFRLFSEVFTPRADNSHESVHDFVSRRCGEKIADYLIDPFVSGVFAGDVKRLHMASAFPKMVALEDQYGSLIKGMFQRPHNKTGKTLMYSFKNGMGELINHLAQRYAKHIHLNEDIKNIASLKADHVHVTVPAYAAVPLLSSQLPTVANLLETIVYAPVAVVGLGFSQSAFRKHPKGFGYLIPSSEKKPILGVLVESNVYDHRASQQRVMIRVMMGGRHHPNIINDDYAKIKENALAELNSVYGLIEDPLCQWIKVWPKAIPQYEMDYPRLIGQVSEILLKHPSITLGGNYIGGISFNDSIMNAKSFAYSLTI